MIMRTTMSNSAQPISHHTSRRAFLQGLAFSGAVLPLLPEVISFGAETPAASNSLGQIGIANPSFSRAERDRRWAAIRRVMARSQWKLDVILAPASSDTAYPRYLTQIGGRGGSADVIFPRDESKPVYALTPTARNRSF